MGPDTSTGQKGVPMDIKQLYYFTAVAQAGSYSKAAESLAVSQPTLSVTVKKLEEELGVQLFYAFNREQHLTDEGLRLWTKAKQILDLYQETLDDMKPPTKTAPANSPWASLRCSAPAFSAT